MALSVDPLSFDFSTLNAVPKKKNDKAQTIQDRFMRMLLAQLKNQNPMNPLSNADTTAQMAQISTVSGIETLNQTVSTLMQHIAAAQRLNATQFIGRQVLAPGNQFLFSPDPARVELQQQAISVALPKQYQDGLIRLYNERGETIKEISIPPGKTGFYHSVWDGMLPNGKPAPSGPYFVKAVGVVAEQRETLPVHLWQSVRSVAFDQAAPNLQLSNGNTVRLEDIQQLR